MNGVTENSDWINTDFLVFGLRSIENLRSKTGLDVELSDKLMSKTSSIPKIKYIFSKRAFSFEELDFLRNKIDLLNFIKTSHEGLVLKNIMSAYKGVKTDLLKLVKFGGKERKLILIKGKTPLDISIFSFNSSTWMPVSQSTLNSWHSA